MYFSYYNILLLAQKMQRMWTRAESHQVSLNPSKLPRVWKYSRICDMSCLTFFLFQVLQGINLHIVLKMRESLQQRLESQHVTLFLFWLTTMIKQLNQICPFMYKIYFFGSWQLVPSFSLIQFETAVPNLCKTFFFFDGNDDILNYCTVPGLCLFSEVGFSLC